MDEGRREQIERQHRPDLFADCRACGEEMVKTSTHVCDSVRRDTYQASLEPRYLPNPAVVHRIGEALLVVLRKHHVVVTTGILRELAETVEPMTRGPQG